MCVCGFKLHVTTQSGPDILVIPCGVCWLVCVCVHVWVLVLSILTYQARTKLSSVYIYYAVANRVVIYDDITIPFFPNIPYSFHAHDRDC